MKLDGGGNGGVGEGVEGYGRDTRKGYIEGDGKVFEIGERIMRYRDGRPVEKPKTVQGRDVQPQ